MKPEASTREMRFPERTSNLTTVIRSMTGGSGRRNRFILARIAAAAELTAQAIVASERGVEVTSAHRNGFREALSHSRFFKSLSPSGNARRPIPDKVSA